MTMEANGVVGRGHNINAPEHLKNLLIASFNALGPIGGVFSAAMSNYLTSKRFAHIQSVLDALAMQLNSLPNETLETVLTSDEFLHLCISAMEIAQKEHRESKRKKFGVMLAHMAADTHFEYDLFAHFLSLLGDIGDLHMTLVMNLAQRGVQGKEDKNWCSFEELAAICQTVVPEQPREIISSALQKLAASGIVKTKGAPTIMFNTNPVGLWYVSSYSITPTGEKFVEYLSEGGVKGAVL